MRRTIPGLLLVATLGLSGLLTACGSDDADEPDTKDSTSQSDTNDADDADDTADADDNDAPDADGDKPDRDDVIEGYTKIVQDTGKQTGMEIPDNVVNKVVTCFVDAVYDDASVATLEALEDGNAAGIDPADAKLFTDAQTTCAKSIS